MRTVNSSQISAKGNTYELYSVTVAWEPLQRSSVESGVILSGSEQLSSAWWLRLKEIRVRFPMIRTHGDAFRLPVLKSMPDSQRSCSWLTTFQGYSVDHPQLDILRIQYQLHPPASRRCCGSTLRLSGKGQTGCCYLIIQADWSPV